MHSFAIPMFRLFLTIAFAAISSQVMCAQSPKYVVHDLGFDSFLHGYTVSGGTVLVLGSHTFTPGAINNSGQVVGCTSISGQVHAFRTAPNAAFSPATDDLGTLGGLSSCAAGINSSGQVVGFSTTAGGVTRGFRTAPNAHINAATDDVGALGASPVPETQILTLALDINDSGQVVGSSQRHAFRTAPNSAINPATDNIGNSPVLSGTTNEAFSINSAGNVAGEFLGGPVIFPTLFLFTGGTVTPGPFIRAPFQQFTGINDNGQVVEGANALRVWQGGPITTLAACTLECAANALNNSLQVVGRNERNFAFLYSNGAVNNLNDLIPVGSGWLLHEAIAINERGQIIGNGQLNGVNRAFRLDPLPAPQQMISDMIALIASFQLDQGTTTNLTASLNAALDSLNRGNAQAARNQLNAFQNKVRALSGNKLTSAQAEELLEDAEATIQFI